MIIINKQYVLENKDEIIKEMQSGKIFIYPTDTIYGIGCNAQNKKAVIKIREIKKRTGKPFSVISPSIDWIKDSCVVKEKAEEWLKKLPGPYTLILKIKNKKAIAEEVSNGNTLGVRIPDNWFAKLVAETGIPFVTTSVNITNEKFMTSLNDLNNEIKEKVDYVVDEGTINNKPSTVINLINNREDILR